MKKTLNLNQKSQNINKFKQTFKNNMNNYKINY
jgi:hypothetical protein